MKAIVTGLNGTVAPVLAELLKDQNIKVVGWDRQKISPDDKNLCREYLQQQKSNYIFHLAMGSEKWAQLLAEYSYKNDIKFVFTSSAMVFDCKPNGPHNVVDMRTAKDDYGQYKIRCEDAISEVSKSAIIARIGWQIGSKRGGNNMLEALYSMQEQGAIQASEDWFPATSFIEDTCKALIDLVQKDLAGIYHIDSNRNDKWNFVEIVQQLKSLHKANWLIERNQSYKHDQRLIDNRIQIRSLSQAFLEMRDS